MSSRRFTEKQTAEIMRKAADHQIQGLGKSESEGVTETELRAAAHELGIQDSAIDAALETLDAPALATKAGIFGGPFQQDEELIFDGSMSEEQWEEVFSDLRVVFREPGFVNQRGSTHEWTGTGGGVDANTFTVRQSGRTIRLKHMSDISGLGSLAYILSVIPMFISVGIFAKIQLPVVMEVVMGVVWVALLLFGARTLSTALARKRARTIHEMMQRIRGRLETPASVRANLAATAILPVETQPGEHVKEDA